MVVLLLRRYWCLLLISLLVSVSTVLFSLGWVYWFRPIQNLYVVVVECTSVSCAEAEIMKYSLEHSEDIPQTISTLWYLLEHDYIVTDARNFSPLIHSLGHQWLQEKQDPIIALELCGSEWVGGCKHGVVMGYLDEHYAERSTDGWLQWCQTELSGQDVAECIHGIGHSFMEQQNNNLMDTVVLCNNLIDEYELAACGSGVLMEYAIGHDSNLAYQELPCTELPGQWQSICYASAGSYRQYIPGYESFMDSLQWCQQQAQPYAVACQGGVQQRINLTQP